MRKFFIRHTEFLGNIAILISGKTIAAAIALAFVPVIARLFAPGDFGIAAMFASTTGIVASIATLRYGTAIVLPENEAEAASIMAFSYRVLLSVCVAFWALLATYSMSSMSWNALDLMSNWKWLLPAAVFLLSSIFILDNWLTRHKHFRGLSASLVARNLGTSVSRVALGSFYGSSASGLIVGYFIGLLCQNAVQLRKSQDGLRTLLGRINWATAKSIGRRYSDFPKYDAPANLVFSLAVHLPVILFGIMFSPAIAGLYAMADRLCQAPVTIVATSVRRVFLQKAAEIRNQGRSLQKAFSLSVGALALAGSIPFTSLWLFGQPLATWVLGDKWHEAGQFIEIIAPWLFLVLTAAPCNAIFVVLRRQQFWLALTIIVTISRLCAFGLAAYIGADPEWTLRAFVVVSMFGSSLNILTAFTIASWHIPPAGTSSAPSAGG